MAFALFLLVNSTLFLNYFISTKDITTTLKILLDFYIPISGTCLLISFLIPKNEKKSLLFLQCFFYILFLIGIQFGIKEILIPYLDKTPSITPAPSNAPMKIILKEFEQIPNLPTKTGMVVKSSSKYFIFGTISQQNPTSYLIQNVFIGGIKKSNLTISLFARHAKTIQNTIILYKANIFTTSNNMLIPSHTLPKNYALPIPFDISSLYDLWNTTDPKDIKLIPILMNKNFSSSFSLPIKLALFQYHTGFITLLIIGALGIACKNLLSFKNSNIIGSTGILICSYPFVLLLFYYLLLIAQSIINYTT